MTPADRLRAAIHMESAAIAPQTSPLIEAAKEVLVENEKLLDALKQAVDWLEGEGLYSQADALLALTQQTALPKDPEMAVIPDDADGPLEVKTTYERVRE